MFKAKDMFEAFQKYRGDAIVIPTGTAGRNWGEVSTNQKRDATLGGAMGQTARTRESQIDRDRVGTNCG